MDKVIILAALAALVAGLIGVGRLLARRRLSQAQALSRHALWAALQEQPDGRPAIVAFSTPSCMACRTAQRPALDTLARRAGGTIRLIAVNVAERPEAGRAFGILTVPATAVLDNHGGLLAVNHGFTTAERLAGQLGLSYEGAAAST